jgi:hypothetical protein
MDKQALIDDLHNINQTKGDHAQQLFDKAEQADSSLREKRLREKALRVGDHAEKAGFAARALESGDTVEEVNESWNGIAEF